MQVAMEYNTSVQNRIHLKPRELHERKGKPDPVLVTDKCPMEAKSQRPQAPLQCILQRRATRREGSRLQPNTGHSSKPWPACLPCLFAWACGVGEPTSCVLPVKDFFFSCVAGDILFENLLTFRITGFLLTLLLVLVEWEFSWKDEALFTLVIEWLWRRKGMGQKQGTSNCCHTHADKTTSL